MKSATGGQESIFWATGRIVAHCMLQQKLETFAWLVCHYQQVTNQPVTSCHYQLTSVGLKLVGGRAVYGGQDGL